MVKSDHIRRLQAQVGFTCQTSRTNNKGDIGTFKVHFMGYFGTLWMTLNKELESQMSESL